MEMSLSRKALNVFSILDLVFGILAMAFGVLLLAATGVIATDPGLSAEFAQQIGAITVVGGAFAAIIAEGLGTVLEGVLGRIAVKNPEKVMPIWYFSIFALVLSAVDLVLGFVNQLELGTIMIRVLSAAFQVVLFLIVNNVKKEAGK